MNVNFARKCLPVQNSSDESIFSFFPKILESNDTGKLTEESFALWEKNKNNITIGFDSGPDAKTSAQDVYIGGPASAVAAALHAQSGTQGRCVRYSELIIGHYTEGQTLFTTIPFCILPFRLILTEYLDFWFTGGNDLV